MKSTQEKSKKANRNITCYRGVSRNYGEDANCIEKNFTPSILRQSNMTIEKEIESYEASFEIANKNNLFSQNYRNSKLFDDNKTVKTIIKILGIFQHYNFKSRLLDVTLKKDVAEYFACCENFNEDGFVFAINSPMYKENAEAALTTKLNDLCIFEKKAKRKIAKNSNIVFEYKSFLKTKSNNLRYDRQSGAFILLKSIYSNDKIEFDNLNHEKIKKEEKIKKLFHLSKKGFNYVKLFPDNDDSLTCQISFHHFVSGLLSKEK